MNCSEYPPPMSEWGYPDLFHILFRATDAILKHGLEKLPRVINRENMNANFPLGSKRKLRKRNRVKGFSLSALFVDIP